MTYEIATWIVGAAAIPLLGFSVRMWYRTAAVEAALSANTQLMVALTDRGQREDKRQEKTASDVDLLVKMHQEPDKFGFGTSNTNRVFADNTAAMRELTHYIQYQLEQVTGVRPPPPSPFKK